MSLLKSYLLALACVAVVLCATEVEVTPQVIGGTNSEIVPYLASLRDAAYYHICGCSIIKVDWVLTAAHCVVSPAYPKYVVAGTNNTTGGGWLYNITNITSHSNFDNTRGIHDIAAVRISPPVIVGSTIAIIPLATVPSVGSTCNMAGFGWTSYPGGTVSPDLQTISMTVYSQTQCVRDLRLIMTVYSSNFCTKVANGKGACYGDSGSGIVFNNELIGFVQRVANGCALNKPDVHVRVSSYSSWITQNTQNTQ